MIGSDSSRVWGGGGGGFLNFHIADPGAGKPVEDNGNLAQSASLSSAGVYFVICHDITPVSLFLRGTQACWPAHGVLYVSSFRI